jgi:hypothetical protein
VNEATGPVTRFEQGADLAGVIDIVRRQRGGEDDPSHAYVLDVPNDPRLLLHGGGTGCQSIRAYAISPGPIRTRAASGIDRFDELLAAAAEQHLMNVDDVGALAAFLVGDGARRIRGTIIPVDGGQHLMA